MEALFMATRTLSPRLITTTVNTFTSITSHGSCIYEAECQCIWALVKSPASAMIEIVNMFYTLVKKKKTNRINYC